MFEREVSYRASVSKLPYRSGCLGEPVFTSVPISESEQTDLKTLIHFAYRDVAEMELGAKIVILVALGCYIAAVWISGSVLVAVAGGVIVIAYRTLSVELFLKRRLTLLTDLLVEMDKRHCERSEQIHDAILKGVR